MAWCQDWNIVMELIELGNKRSHKTKSRYVSIYKRISKDRLADSPFKVYLSLTLGFADFIVHCKDMASLVIDQGTAVILGDSALKKRIALGLPNPRFDDVDIKRLAFVTGLSRIIEEKTP